MKVFEIVTNQIIEQLEKKVIPWKKPWKTQTLRPCNLISMRPYHGINIFLLILKNSPQPYWLTYKQAKENGGHVKKGEKSTEVVYWKMYKVEKTEKEIEREKAREGKEVEKFKKIPILRYYRVFNVAQTEGLAHLIPEDRTKQIDFDPIKKCEKIVSKYKDKPPIKEAISGCFYDPLEDYIGMVNPDNFKSAEEYYSTLFHELTHSTGHEKRLNRDISNLLRDKDDYGQEELTAEMGASFLSNIAGISEAAIENSSAYISGWLKSIKQDPKMLVFSASRAQKAVDYILGEKDILHNDPKKSHYA